jgi:hypothetical protein
MDSSRRPLILGLLLALACVAVFGEIGRHGFVRWDDEINVYRNPYLNPVTPSNLVHFWTGTGMGKAADTVYRPLVYSVYALIAPGAAATPYLTDGQGAGLDARPFHAVSLLVHVLNTLLVFGLLRRLVKNDWAASAGAALFALHPLQVEAVAWVSGLTDLLGALFSLLALSAFVRFREAGQRRWYALATLWFALALLSKPSAAVLPLLALILDCWVLGRPWRESVRALIGWLPLALASVAVAHHAEPVLMSGVATPWWTRPLVAGDALLLSVRHLVWPVGLGIDYGRSPGVALADRAWLSSLIVLVGGVCVWQSRRRYPWLLAGASLFAATLLPTLGLIPFRFQTFSTVADRYTYLALLGPSLALAWGLAHLPHRLPARLAAGSVCAAVLILMGAGSAAQVTYWRSSVALFDRALVVNPRSWMAHLNLGGILADSGRREEAVAQYKQAMRLRPNDAAKDAYADGVTLVRQGRKAEAAADFKQALEYQPNFTPAREALRALD